MRRQQSLDLKELLDQTGVAGDQELKTAIDTAVQTTDEFVSWLQSAKDAYQKKHWKCSPRPPD